MTNLSKFLSSLTKKNFFLNEFIIGVFQVFYALILYLATFLNLVILEVFVELYTGSCHLLIMTIMALSLLYISSLFLSCLISLAIVSSSMLNRNDTGHLSLFLILAE